MLNPRDIRGLGYWQKSSKVMMDSYINRDPQALEKDAQKYEILFSFIRQLAPKKILEVGCGFGYSLKKIAEAFPAIEVHGCDFSDTLISLAKEYCGTAIPADRLNIASATDLELYSDKSFDLIVTQGCLMCLDSGRVTKALHEFKRLASNLLLVEPDYSYMSLMETLRFRQERNYPINNYRSLISSVSQLKLVGANQVLSKEDPTNVTFFLVKVEY